jgi:serine/threonine protein kinase
VTSDEQKRVHSVLRAALQRDPEERDAFLDEACAGRPWLRAEAAALLAAHHTAGDSFPASALESATRAPADSLDATLDGRVVGPYIIRHEIGRGGMGVVYLADDTRLSRRVALKALSPGVGRDVDRRERLKREARAAAALSHPGIATVYALEEIEGELYLACEYVPGQTLRALLEIGPPPPAQVVDIAMQLARAMAVAHAHGVVHRDLKPENVVRTPAGVLKVLDFGIARVEDLARSRITQTGTVLGTPAYMAPEQIRGEDVDFRSDLFSFGVLIYEMASGSNPFEAGTLEATIARILNVEPAALSEVCPSSGPQLDRIVAACLCKQPLERYKSTQLLVADLENLQAGMSTGRDQAAKSRRPEIAGGSRVSPALTPRWWWEFHQGMVSAVYVLMIYAAWRVRAWLPQPAGMLLFFSVLACAAAATTLRLHLWFTARFYPAELGMQRARALPWTRSCDIGFAVALLMAALGIGGAHLEVATLLVTVSVATAVASFVIEPATARAAFRGKSGAIRTPSKKRQ